MASDRKEFLEPRDIIHLRAAEGWLGLSCPAEAGEELAQLSPGVRSHPDVLAVRYEIFAKAQRWENCLEISREILKAEPKKSSGWIQQSFALHELKRTREALDSLLPAVNQFPLEITVRYNLACYECVLGNLPGAKRRLSEAFSLAHSQKCYPLWRSQALEDIDLEPLRPFLKQVIV
jgi:predicted Zn-dependent protease